MTKEHWMRMMPFIEDFIKGKALQWNQEYEVKWNDIDPNIGYDFSIAGRKIRLKPIPRIWYVCPICQSNIYKNKLDAAECCNEKPIQVVEVLE